MSKHDLHSDVEKHFGNFFFAQGFFETKYVFDNERFGNEILEFVKPSGVAVRFVRDRGRISIDVKARGKQYMNIDLLLEELGHDRHGYGHNSASEIPENLAQDLIAEWPRLEVLAAKGASEASDR